MEDFTGEVKKELVNILQFWDERAVDQEKGGFIGRIDGFGNSDPGASKGGILNARILWTYSAAYNLLGEDRYAALAHRTYEYIVNHFVDEQYGGTYWELDHRGNPVNTKKQIYAQAFFIYALSEYYKFSKVEKAKQLAIDLYRLIEKHSFDEQYPGYLEAFDREWRLLDDLRLSDKDANEKKTMNTHLHVLEGYTNLCRIWDDEYLKAQLDQLVKIHMDKMMNASNHHLDLFFDVDWKVKSDVYSFGHDIEAAWLLCDAVKFSDDKALIEKVGKWAVDIAQITISEGLDMDGGLFNEGRNGRVIDTDKHWWPQAEMLIGLLNAYELSGDDNFLNTMKMVWDFIQVKMIDHEKGEWYFRINRSGISYVEEDKVGFWKCPYHNSRACIELLTRINRLFSSKNAKTSVNYV